MPAFTVSGRLFELDRETVERALAGELPDPLSAHYVVIAGRRFPPKQALSRVTGLDRADFTTHQARRILRRLGFTAERIGGASSPRPEAQGPGPHSGRQAKALAAFAGKWVALAMPTEVLVAADDPRDVLSWLARHGRTAEGGMLKVPETPAEAGGAAPL